MKIFKKNRPLKYWVSSSLSKIYLRISKFTFAWNYVSLSLWWWCWIINLYDSLSLWLCTTIFLEKMKILKNLSSVKRLSFFLLSSLLKKIFFWCECSVKPCMFKRRETQDFNVRLERLIFVILSSKVQYSHNLSYLILFYRVIERFQNHIHKERENFHRNVRT